MPTPMVAPVPSDNVHSSIRLVADHVPATVMAAKASHNMLSAV